MGWPIYSELFMSSSGRLKTTVPKSCIESAEYIMQCIANKAVLPWSVGQTRNPHVVAYFGKGVAIDITATPDFHLGAEGLEDYPFTSLPNVGEGLVCLNRTKSDLGYNMHFGAVLARSGDAALVSNMMEAFGVKVVMAIPDTIEISSPDKFRSDNFHVDSAKYALGLLRVA